MKWEALKDAIPDSVMSMIPLSFDSVMSLTPLSHGAKSCTNFIFTDSEAPMTTLSFVLALSMTPLSHGSVVSSVIWNSNILANSPQFSKIFRMWISDLGADVWWKKRVLRSLETVPLSLRRCRWVHRRKEGIGGSTVNFWLRKNRKTLPVALRRFISYRSTRI